MKGLRAALWVGGAVGSIFAASHILRGAEDGKIVWLPSLAGVLLPGIGKAIKIDAVIRDDAEAAAKFKNLQGEFRRARLVWSHKPPADFEDEARKLFKAWPKLADGRALRQAGEPGNAGARRNAQVGARRRTNEERTGCLIVKQFVKPRCSHWSEHI